MTTANRCQCRCEHEPLLLPMILVGIEHDYCRWCSAQMGANNPDHGPKENDD